MNLRFEEEAKKERKKKLIIELVRYVIEIILVIALAWVIINFALKKVIMIGNSMENTISSGQELLVNTVFKHFISPKRGTVIAFYPENTTDNNKSDSDSNILIRRIAGLPGETIQMIEGIIYIDDKPIEEKYEFDRKVSAGRAEEKIHLGEDEYFVLSDKRTDLDDSRSDSFTTVKRDNIIGDVFLSLEPLSFISGPDAESSEDEPSESAQPDQKEAQ